MMLLSASLSCASRDTRRMRRPKTTARTIKGGTEQSMSKVSLTEVRNSSTPPPTSVASWLRNCGMVLMRAPPICDRSADSRLVNSPTRRWA